MCASCCVPAALFDNWATTSLPVFSPPAIVSLTPYYLPFWAFECDVIARNTKTGSATRERAARPSGQVRSEFRRRSVTERHFGFFPAKFTC